MADWLIFNIIILLPFYHKSQQRQKLTVSDCRPGPYLQSNPFKGSKTVSTLNMVAAMLFMLLFIVFPRVNVFVRTVNFNFPHYTLFCKIRLI